MQVFVVELLKPVSGARLAKKAAAEIFAETGKLSLNLQISCLFYSVAVLQIDFWVENGNFVLAALLLEIFFFNKLDVLGNKTSGNT